MHDLSVLLAFAILLNSMQPASCRRASHLTWHDLFHRPQADMYAMLHLQCLLGVTIGLGWADGKALVAYVNLGPILPARPWIYMLHGWPLHFGVGVILQTLAARWLNNNSICMYGSLASITTSIFLQSTTNKAALKENHHIRRERLDITKYLKRGEYTPWNFMKI